MLIVREKILKGIPGKSVKNWRSCMSTVLMPLTNWSLRLSPPNSATAEENFCLWSSLPPASSNKTIKKSKHSSYRHQFPQFPRHNRNSALKTQDSSEYSTSFYQRGDVCDVCKVGLSCPNVANIWNKTLLVYIPNQNLLFNKRVCRVITCV